MRRARGLTHRVRRRVALGRLPAPRPTPHPPDVLLRVIVHLLVTGTPRPRRLAPPIARVARALQRPLAPDRLRLLRGTVWIASTPDIPAARTRE